MRLAAPAPSSMLPWLAERANIAITPLLQAIAAISDDGQIAGMVGYDGWLPSACAMHVALEDPRAFWTLVRPAFRIPFQKIGLALVVGQVVSTNKQSLRFAKGLGFRERVRFRDAWGAGKDMVLLELRREDCRWIKETHRRAA